MEKKKPRVIKSKKPKVDDHYKVLGLRSNCRQERIKERYIELVKQYPPETHPEEFEKIRKAYEVLRDPEQRKKYNFLRKNGSSIEKLMKKAYFHIEREEWLQAEELLQAVLSIDPKLNPAQLALAQLYLELDDLERFNHRMQLLYDEAVDSDKPVALLLKGKMLMESEYEQEALDVTQAAIAQHPEYASHFHPLLVELYLALEREEEALRLIDRETAILKDVRLDHLHLFTLWVTLIVQLDRWALVPTVQKRFRKFLRAMSMQDEDTKQIVEEELVLQYQHFIESGILRPATFYLELMEGFNPKHPVLTDKKQIQEWDRVQREIMRMAKDDRVFPLVIIEAFKEFGQETGVRDLITEYSNALLPTGLLYELEELDFEYAASIKYMQKKYPVVYRRYKQKWDELFEEKTRGLNREEKRSLK